VAGKSDSKAQAYLAREGFPSTGFHFEGFPRRLSARALVYPLTLAAAWACARRVWRRESPDLFVGMGGYVSVPLGLVARGARAPIVLHEQNVKAGLANRFLSRFARSVAVSFPGTRGLSTRAGRVVCTGLPLRSGLLPRDGREARAGLGLDPDRPTVLVFGGSQGARALNASVIQGAEKIDPGWQIIHLTGPADEAGARTAYANAGRRAFVAAYWEDMAGAYSAADFVVCRAGANTVMELQRMGKPALLVPYPRATDDHQAANARTLELSGQARVLPEKDMTPDSLSAVLSALPGVKELRRRADERVVQLPPEFLRAAERLADLIEGSV
jgi:UDP-N-acetylglucosamine--N-acetylmuramyl-(pentapeptide) pyrophosphoryl-undecaprenol N-acetylglucosamine transferase